MSTEFFQQQCLESRIRRAEFLKQRTIVSQAQEKQKCSHQIVDYVCSSPLVSNISVSAFYESAQSAAATGHLVENTNANTASSTHLLVANGPPQLATVISPHPHVCTCRSTCFPIQSWDVCFKKALEDVQEMHGKESSTAYPS